MNVWPFMFAASKTADYQFVALPEFLDRGSCDALRKRLEIDDADPKRTRTATTVADQLGNVSCVYRAGPIVIDNEIRTDSAGRKLLFAFGVIVKEIPAGPLLDKLLDLIDASQPAFEKRLRSFLNANGQWTPLVTKAVKFPVDQEEPKLGSFNRLGKLGKFSNSTLLVLFALIVNLGASAFLYLEFRSLDSKFNAIRAAVKFDAIAARPQKPDVENNPAARAPEAPANSGDMPPQPRAQELEKRGRLTIEREHQ
jgi:hypothetical protein